MLKKLLTQITLTIVAYIYLTIMSNLVKRIQTNIRKKKAYDALGWPAEYRYQAVMRRFLKK